MPQLYSKYDLGTDSRTARQLFCAGIEALLTDRGNGRDQLVQATQVDPDFYLAYVHLARLAANAGDFELARKQSVKAEARAVKASDFALSQGACAEALASGKASQAISLMESHINEYDHDLFILISLMQQIFFDGGLRKKERAIEVGEKFYRNFFDNDIFLPRFAFHLQESGQRNRAVEIADACLNKAPGQAYAIHVKLHAWMEEGKYGEGTRFLESVIHGLDHNTFLFGHLLWHQAVAQLESGRLCDAIESYGVLKSMPHKGASHLDLADDVGFLWRLRLLGNDLYPDWISKTARLTEKLKSSESPFVIVHMGLFHGFMKDHVSIEKLIEQVGPLKSDVGNVLRNVLSAVLQFIDGNFTSANDLFRLVPPASVVAIGGSNVERSLIEKIRTESLKRTANKAG